MQGKKCNHVGADPAFSRRLFFNIGCQFIQRGKTASGATCLGLRHSVHLHPPREADLLYHGGQGTLCPIDLRPGESFQFLFKFSWAALHCYRVQMQRQLTDAVSCCPCT